MGGSSGGGTLALVMFSFTAFTAILPPSFCLSFPLLCPLAPFHLDSWTVRGVTGVSRLSPSLSQLVDLCLRNDSTHSSSLPARIDKIAWQQKLLLMCCDHATQSAAPISICHWAQIGLWVCMCVGMFIFMCGSVYLNNLLDLHSLGQCKRKRQGRGESDKTKDGQIFFTNAGIIK